MKRLIKKFGSDRVNIKNIASTFNHLSCIEFITIDLDSPFFLETKQQHKINGVIVGIDNTDPNNVMVEFEQLDLKQKILIEMKQIRKLTTFLNHPACDLKM